MSSILWDNDEPITDLGVDVPRWIEQDISPAGVAAIVQGGCASGSYMPAVTYCEAVDTMSTYGDDILQYIEDIYGGLPSVDGQSWGGIACTYVSCAVELWACSIEDELIELLEDGEDD